MLVQDYRKRASLSEVREMIVGIDKHKPSVKNNIKSICKKIESEYDNTNSKKENVNKIKIEEQKNNCCAKN